MYGGNPAPFTEDMRPDPAGFYALSKHFGEELVRYFGGVHKLSWLILRIGILYGPAQNPGMFIPSLVTSLLRGESFEMTEGRQVRDFIYIDDVTDAVVRSLAQRTVCGVFNIGSGTAYSMRDTAETIQRLVGAEGLLRPGARAYRTDEVWDYRLDITRTRKVLGWVPAVAFEDGLRRTIEYYRHRGTDTTRT